MKFQKLKKYAAVLLTLCCLLVSLTGCAQSIPEDTDLSRNQSLDQNQNQSQEQTNLSNRSVPAAQTENDEAAAAKVAGEAVDAPYEILNDNQPDFPEVTTEAFESYSELDELGRCGRAYACLGQELMPTEPRGEIGSVKPTGWQTRKYDCVDGKYLYNRCHLIGFQLAGENANDRNLITGTCYMNTEGMLPFENMVADYIKETGGHVMYRVTPIFDGDNLVASGVQMEAYSVEDEGESICFNVLVYNVQPGVSIDYATGSSEEMLVTAAEPGEEQEYVLNTKTRKFHRPDCASAEEMSERNRAEYTGSRAALIEEGYEPCKRCNP